MSDKNNNLTELNNILFETLRGVKDGSIDAKKATTVSNIANSIISNTKTQLSAYKMTSGRAFGDVFGQPSTPALASGDTYKLKSEFSIMKGYDSVSDAIGGMGKAKFEAEFTQWIKDNSITKS